MFCVVQEIETKKEKKGKPKKIESSFTKYSFMEYGKYWYSYSTECFTRPIKKAYRISIHQNYRDNGKVRKNQYVLCTMNYYDFVDGLGGIYDFCGRKIEAVSKLLGVPVDDIYNVVYEKTDILENKIKEEYQKTEEYITSAKNSEITTIYAAKKVQFNSKYGLSGDEYDQCYDVFGVLQNSSRLEEIKADYKARKEYEKKSSSYYEKYYDNYTNNANSGYSNILSSNHKTENQEILKKFYRDLSKKYHPDANADTGTSEEMKLINQLKQEWGI